jgi:hypothetical protein
MAGAAVGATVLLHACFQSVSVPLLQFVASIVSK